MRIKFKGKLSDIEVWKRTSVHPNYFISTQGRLWSLSTHIIGHGNEDKDGYYRKTFSKKGERDKNIRIHKLVATHFIPNPDNLETVDHKNSKNIHDNSVSNLQWMSRPDNSKKAHKNRTKYSGGVIKKVVCIETSKIYKNAAEAQRDTGCYSHAILECCKNNRPFAYVNYPSREKKLHWRYATQDEIDVYNNN